MNAVFQVKDLKKNFGGLAVTNNVSLSLSAGDRLALIGPNGAGKTTFVNLVTGALKPDSGQVFLGGADVTQLKPAERVRRGLIRSFQVTRLFSDMTPEEHVALAILQRDGRSGAMFGHYSGRSQVMDEAGTILRQLGLALAVALRPKVLLLDEPAAGVPQSETALIEEALDRLPPDLAVLMIEHDMDLVFRFAKRVIVLAAGTVIFDGSPKDVTQDRRVREAYLGSYADASNVA